MASPISKESLDRLAELSRVALEDKEKTRLLGDLGKILDHFEELKTLDTQEIPPARGGNDLMNVFRDDTERENTHRGQGAEGFPASQDGFLKIPPVFE